MPSSPRSARTCLVVGSYPPAPGPAAAATVAAVRRAWAAGLEVVVASPRPSAAALVIPVAGPAVGRALAKLRLGVDEVVVGMEPGWPLGRGRRPEAGRQPGTELRLDPSSLLKWWRQWETERPMGGAELERSARSLAAALSGFERAELVVTGDPGVGADVLALLWPSVARVTASSEEVAAVLRAAGAPGVTVVEPYSAAGLPLPELPGRRDGQTMSGSPAPVAGAAAPSAAAAAEAVRSAASWLPGAVNPLEPGELLLVARGRRLIGSAARKVLGPRAPAVRAYLLQAWVRGRLVLSRARARAGAAIGPGPDKSTR